MLYREATICSVFQPAKPCQGLCHIEKITIQLAGDTRRYLHGGLVTIMLKKNQRTLLVDGDILLYKFGFGGQQKVEWSNDAESEWAEEENAKYLMDIFLDQLLKNTKAKDLLICLTGKRPFRYDVLPTYKHNRKEAKKPLMYQDLKDYLQKEYPSAMRGNIEADDIMGILGTKDSDNIITSIDKDLIQIPSWHFNWNKDTKPRLITKSEGEKFFWQQCLSGDPVDGFAGVPGIGPVKARNIVNSCETEAEAWGKIVKTYESKGMTEEDALVQARCAYILRCDDYDWDRGRVKLWSPDKKKDTDGD